MSLWAKFDGVATQMKHLRQYLCMVLIYILFSANFRKMKFGTIHDSWLLLAPMGERMMGTNRLIQRLASQLKPQCSEYKRGSKLGLLKKQHMFDSKSDQRVVKHLQFCTEIVLIYVQCT